MPPGGTGRTRVRSAGQVCDARTRSPGWVWGSMLGSKTQRVPFSGQRPGPQHAVAGAGFLLSQRPVCCFYFSLLFCQRVGVSQRSGGPGQLPSPPPIPPAQTAVKAWGQVRGAGRACQPPQVPAVRGSWEALVAGPAQSNFPLSLASSCPPPWLQLLAVSLCFRA